MPYAADNVISREPIGGGIAISEDQYAAAIAGIMEGRIIAVRGGALYLDEPLTEEPEQPETPSPDLVVMKAQASAEIDYAAEGARLIYITNGAGQAMTYQQKAAEAARFLASVDADPADYPLLSAEVGITAPDIAGVAAVVDERYRAWQIVGAKIERVRLTAKRDIDAAVTVETVAAIVAAVSWP